MEKDGPKRLEMSWGGFWKDFTVKLDGVAVLTANGSSELKAGRSARLPDGSTLEVRLETGFGKNGLAVTRNGQPLPGSSTDPESLVKVAGAVVYVLAGLNFLFGVIALFVWHGAERIYLTLRDMHAGGRLALMWICYGTASAFTFITVAALVIIGF